MIDNIKIQKFMDEKIKFEKNRFITYTSLKVPCEIWVSSQNNFDDIVIVNERWNITREWSEYLLDEFDPKWERENLSFDKWYFKWYVAWLNDFLKFLNTTK